MVPVQRRGISAVREHFSVEFSEPKMMLNDKSVDVSIEDLFRSASASPTTGETSCLGCSLTLTA